MSESKRKAQRKDVKLMTEEAGVQKTADEMARSIAKMYEDRDKKLVGAKEHLVSTLEVTVEKYRTASGVMRALDTVRMVCSEPGNGMRVRDEIGKAKAVATSMAKVTMAMAEKARELDPEELDKLCDGFYDKEFSEGDGDEMYLVEQLMVLNLCQAVGPDAEDIVDFAKTADEEIDKARQKLVEYCQEHDLDFNEICGPHDKCPDCLCMSCSKDCKEGKQIVEGQSAYDVCENFVAAEE